MQGLARSIGALVWGVISRFIYWLPFILLDISDYWEKYIRPGILHFTGKDVVMPSGTLLVGAAVGVVWSVILTYHELRREKLKQDEELTPTVEIDSTPLLQQWIDASSQKPCREFYISVRNPSARALRNVSVYLTDISPRVENLDWLPIPLKIKHDNRSPRHEAFDMNPGGVRHIDMVSHMMSAPHFTIEHSVAGVNDKAPLNTYVLTVRAEGASIALPYQSKFLVKLDPTGKMVCLPAAFLDLDKGLLEFDHDTKAALTRFNATLGELAGVTKEIGDVSRAVAREMDAVRQTNFRWYEWLVGVRTIPDRVRIRAALWSKRLNRVGERLRQTGALYTLQAKDLIENLTGYAEVAINVSAADVEEIKTVRDATAQAVQSVKEFRASVATNQLMRITTGITRSMRVLGSILEGQIETTEGLVEAFNVVILLLEQKVDKP